MIHQRRMLVYKPAFSSLFLKLCSRYNKPIQKLFDVSLAQLFWWQDGLMVIIARLTVLGWLINLQTKKIVYFISIKYYLEELHRRESCARSNALLCQSWCCLAEHTFIYRFTWLSGIAVLSNYNQTRLQSP